MRIPRVELGKVGKEAEPPGKLSLCVNGEVRL